jgi:hypothetical protein
MRSGNLISRSFLSTGNFDAKCHELLLHGEVEYDEMEHWEFKSVAAEGTALWHQGETAHVFR